MIIGTAGHIDHGKTTLVKALTGVNTDRLKEEQARGISIELGYAYTPLPNGDRLGFIDVPGHEKLIHTMAAGASGIDFGLLVVAADDGIMPQTHEHLAILNLLGVGRGAIALTKCDRVDQDRIAQVSAQIRALGAGSFLEGAPVFPVAAVDDRHKGIEQLREHLQEAARRVGGSQSQGLFRLAVDRVFTLTGHGTVVTGTVHSGTVLADDGTDLRLMPANRPVRVRSIHAQNEPAPEGHAGQRCALNLAGVSRNEIKRGDWIADARCFSPTRRVDVHVQLLADLEESLKAWTPVHVLVGASHHTAHAVPLSADSITTGQTGWVQLVFDQPICVMPGDRYIIRNAQANRTLGGGLVIDPEAPDRKRRSMGRLAWLEAVHRVLSGDDMQGLLEDAPYGLSEARLVRIVGRDLKELPAPTGAHWMAAANGAQYRTLVSNQRLQELVQKVQLALDNFHERWPEEPGPDSGRLRRMALPACPDSLWPALREHMLQQGLIQRNGPWLHRPGHQVSLSVPETELADQLLPRLYAGQFDPPWVRDLARELQKEEEVVRRLLRRLVRQGQLFQVVNDLFYHREQIARLAHLVAQLDPQGVRAATLRDATGLGRKRAVQILEFFDRVGYTRRLRDRHVLRPDSASFWLKLS